MRKIRGRFAVNLAAAALLVTAAMTDTGAQGRPTVPSSGQLQVYRTTESRIAIGRSVQIAADEEVSDAVVVIGGSLRIDGRVRGDVVVVGGQVTLGPRSDVRGDVVAVGGGLSREPGARLHGRVSDISIGDWTSWTFGGISLPVVDFGDFGRWLGLLGAAFRVSVLAVFMGFLLLVARAPVARIGRAAATEPGRAFLMGLTAEILFVPALIIACISLIVTIIGIPIAALLIPVSLLVAFVALILGFTGLACRLGEWAEDRLGWRGRSAFLATAIGLLLIVLPTMAARFIGVVPDPLRPGGMGLLVLGAIVEFIAWTIGLGATLMTGFGRWSTSPPPVPPPPQAVTVIG